ncbi:chromosome segregation protein SMC [Actinomyces vulturis]|uniref:chromosome segregation protein SMC n=1 Tax=Actinomyces vulturis TaxID=1857645 RepID=UPI00082E6E5E|nr:chromosome segregation protein SMC [Actinomyces vulturis]
MHLKTLTMKGFKSFASSTTLTLEPGITCVVGPNGSGKSNVVDALTWVMGEQGAKNLRGANMSDVIFAGTSARPPLGRAEVSLTIDNSDGVLPIDYTEVTITRTLFRGGGSEYQINGSPARLLDVQELLSDTGLGRQMHVIVGQGQLDSVLASSAMDRRAFIEEAAGVLKHRRRKERALKKLDSMAADLARVNDLTVELRRQLGPLARQAAVARRARIIQAQERDARARLLADDLVQAQLLLEAGHEDVCQAQRRREAVMAEQDEARVALHQRTEELSVLEREVDTSTRMWQDLKDVARELSSVAQVAHDRLSLLAVPLPQPQGTDPEELERRARQADEELQALQITCTQGDEALITAGEARLAAERCEQETLAALTQAREELSRARESAARLGGRVASAQSRVDASQQALTHAQLALEQAQERQRTAAHHLDALADADECLGDGADPGQAQQRHDAATQALTLVRAEYREIQQDLSEAQAALATWTARAEALAMTMKRETASDASTRLGVSDIAFAQQFTIDDGWHMAIAALLGDFADALMAESFTQAVSALESARDYDIAGLHIVSPPPMSHSFSSSALSWFEPGEWDLQAFPDIRVATEVVHTEISMLLPVLNTLMRGMFLASSRQVAAQFIEVNPQAIVATRDGDLLAAGWVRIAGKAQSTLIEVSAAYDEACEHAEQATAHRDARQEALRQAHERVEAAADEARIALDELRQADAHAAAQAGERARVQAAYDAACADTQRAQTVLTRSQDEHQRFLVALANAKAAFDDVESADHSALEQRVSQTQQELDQATQAAKDCRAREMERRLELRSAQERLSSLQGRAQSLRSAARHQRTAQQAAARQERQRQIDVVVAHAISEQAQAAYEAAQASVLQAQQRRDEAHHHHRLCAHDVAQIRERIEEREKTLSILTDTAHRQEIARAEQRMRVEQLEQRAMEELGIDAEVLVEEYGPHVPVPLLDDIDDADSDEGNGREDRAGIPFVRHEQERRLARAQRDLAKLGKVNPLALQEHQALEERHSFLSEQLADLTQSRDDLLAIVEDIDARVQEVFEQAFLDTAREFETVFATLFPGGYGRLVLTDPSNMLTTGVDIEARPAGKKVSRLSLLSGGERSLAAVALLVAIFKARPSPFYVMDEVEAALDDTNLGRLLEIFTQLRDSSQLIVITHQKRTMEVADRLYGITMRDGVTHAVSHRLETATKVTSL